jgi:hypothetical protein
MRIPFLTLPIYMSYFPKWEPKRPADFAEHVAKLKANLNEPSRRNVIREAQWIKGKLGSELIMLDGAGHHPRVEYPREIADAVAAFGARLWESEPNGR